MSDWAPRTCLNQAPVPQSRPVAYVPNVIVIPVFVRWASALAIAVAGAALHVVDVHVHVADFLANSNGIDRTRSCGLADLIMHRHRVGFELQLWCRRFYRADVM